MTDTAPRIFVVDDDPAQRQCFCLQLRVLGYAYQGFADGMAYLETLRRSRPDCVLMDLHLDGMGCPQIMAAARAMGMDAPVIAITGDVFDSPDAMRARAAGVVEVLTKPVRKSELHSAIERHLACAAAAG
ncbi:MAG: response regulator [Nevskia sp.]|nr:response regulator [Nevskia sp.]